MIIIKLIDTKYVSNLLSIILQTIIDWLDDVLMMIYARGPAPQVHSLFL